MQISTITIHNFRSIGEVTVELGDYTVLVGTNNSGKSNLIDALRVFYEKGLKFEEDRDFPRFNTADKESWIDIEYVLSDEEFANLKDEYRRDHQQIKVRKYLQTTAVGSDDKPKKGIYAYIGGSVSDEHFYGAKNVQQGKLGDIIYIPAASRLDEHTKLTGPSALRDLLNEILKKLVKTSESYKTLSSSFEAFSTSFKGEETDDKKSLSGLERDINTEIDDWGAEFELAIEPINEDDIVKNLVTFHIKDKELNEKFEAGQFGQGFQRHLIFTLIRLAAQYQSSPRESKKKEFTPNMTALLFEEPEAFLHPPQLDEMSADLQLIANEAGKQVIASTHAPAFVSYNTNDIPSIIRLAKQKGQTVAGQISSSQLKDILEDNQEINELLKDTKVKASVDDLQLDMEGLKYFLWLNSERCGMFFAPLVLLVEGATERVLLNYMLRTGQIAAPRGGIFVLDCLGCYNIHRFMNLLGPLKVHHSVLYDTSKNKTIDTSIDKLINESRNPFTTAIEKLPGDIEEYLGIDSAKRPDRKPQHVMFKLTQNQISKSNLQKFITTVQKLI